MDLVDWGYESKDADSWDTICPIPQPITITDLVPMTLPFLTLPRELRDIIYRYLLSTKYTKNVFRESKKASVADFITVPRLTRKLVLNERRVSIPILSSNSQYQPPS